MFAKPNNEDRELPVCQRHVTFTVPILVRFAISNNSRRKRICCREMGKKTLLMLNYKEQHATCLLQRVLSFNDVYHATGKEDLTHVVISAKSANKNSSRNDDIGMIESRP